MDGGELKPLLAKQVAEFVEYPQPVQKGVDLTPDPAGHGHQGQIGLGQGSGIHLVGLDPAFRDEPHLHRVGQPHPATHRLQGHRSPLRELGEEELHTLTMPMLQPSSPYDLTPLIHHHHECPCRHIP